MSETHPSVETLLAGAGSLPERVAIARTWLNENLRNDPRLNRELIEVLLPATEAAGDRNGAAWLQFFLGWLSIDADDYTQGLAIMEPVKSTFGDLGDHEGLSRCLNALGYASFALGLYDLALDYYRESASEAESVGRRDLAATATMNMAECLHELEEPGEALQVIEHCRREYTIAPYNLPVTYTTAGLVHRSLGRLDEAEQELLEAVRMTGGRLHDSLEARQALAEVHLDAGRLAEAGILVETGIEECSQAGERLSGTRFRLTRARLFSMQGHTAEAIPEIEAAIVSARELGARKLEADAEKALYLAWQMHGECRQALAAFVRHSALKDAMKSEQTSRRILGLHAERTKREARHFETLYQQVSAISEIGQRITANLDLDATLETLYDAINGLMDAPTLMVALVDEEQGRLDYRLVMLQGQRKAPFSTLLSEENFGCWCVQHRSDILIGELATEYHQYVSAYEKLLGEGTVEQSLVFVPLLVGDKVAGVLSVQSHLPHAYDKRKVETVRAIGSYIAIAIENARLFRQIHRLATIDSLTGLLNRRRLTETIDEAYLITKRYKTPAGIIMVDMDHFKKVNDTHGHDAGDAVLCAISKVLQASVRSCDSAGRFGGEEFVLLLPETGLEGTGILAERLREAIEALEIPLPAGGNLRLTASFGVSVIHPDDPSRESVLHRADRALYQAKHGGRNRIAFH